MGNAIKRGERRQLRGAQRLPSKCITLGTFPSAAKGRKKTLQNNVYFMLSLCKEKIGKPCIFRLIFVQKTVKKTQIPIELVTDLQGAEEFPWEMEKKRHRRK